MSNSYLLIAASLALGATQPSLAAAQQAAPAAAPTRAALLRNLDTNFKQIDSNGDASLSSAELGAAQAKTLQQRAATIRSRIEAQFTKLDTNRDGQLNKVEFMAAAPIKIPAANGAVLTAQLDKNKDGKVSGDEYRAPILAGFDRADTNKDGTVSVAERQALQAKRK